MEKQFVTYEIAKDLKELGFDEECFALYDAYQDNRLVYLQNGGRNTLNNIKTNESMDFSCLAPLWQQAIDWLETKDIKMSFNYWNNRAIMPAAIRGLYASITTYQEKNRLVKNPEGGYFFTKREDMIRCAVIDAIKLYKKN